MNLVTLFYRETARLLFFDQVCFALDYIKDIGRRVARKIAKPFSLDKVIDIRQKISRFETKVLNEEERFLYNPPNDEHEIKSCNTTFHAYLSELIEINHDYKGYFFGYGHSHESHDDLCSVLCDLIERTEMSKERKRLCVIPKSFL